MLDSCNTGNLSVTRATQTFYLLGKETEIKSKQSGFLCKLEGTKPPSSGKVRRRPTRKRRLQFNRGMRVRWRSWTSDCFTARVFIGIVLLFLATPKNFLSTKNRERGGLTHRLCVRVHCTGINYSPIERFVRLCATGCTTEAGFLLLDRIAIPSRWLFPSNFFLFLSWVNNTLRARFKWNTSIFVRNSYRDSPDNKMTFINNPITKEQERKMDAECTFASIALQQVPGIWFPERKRPRTIDQSTWWSTMNNRCFSFLSWALSMLSLNKNGTHERTQ